MTTLVKRLRRHRAAWQEGVCLCSDGRSQSEGAPSRSFQDAETLARLLIDQQLQQSVRDQVILIDEVSLVSSRQMAQVFALAEHANARVILQGDRHQHGSVERGAVLRLLETEAGIKPAEVLEIQRQKDQYKFAVRCLSEGLAR